MYARIEVSMGGTTAFDTVERRCYIALCMHLHGSLRSFVFTGPRPDRGPCGVPLSRSSCVSVLFIMTGGGPRSLEDLGSFLMLDMEGGGVRAARARAFHPLCVWDVGYRRDFHILSSTWVGRLL